MICRSRLYNQFWGSCQMLVSLRPKFALKGKKSQHMPKTLTHTHTGRSQRQTDHPDTHKHTHTHTQACHTETDGSPRHTHTHSLRQTDRNRACLECKTNHRTTTLVHFSWEFTRAGLNWAMNTVESHSLAFLTFVVV